MKTKEVNSLKIVEGTNCKQCLAGVLTPVGLVNLEGVFELYYEPDRSNSDKLFLFKVWVCSRCEHADIQASTELLNKSEVMKRNYFKSFSKLSID